MSNLHHPRLTKLTTGVEEMRRKGRSSKSNGAAHTKLVASTHFFPPIILSRAQAHARRTWLLRVTMAEQSSLLVDRIWSATPSTSHTPQVIQQGITK